VVKHLNDASKKELPPSIFKGRIYSYSRHFLTGPVAALWEEQLREWYPAGFPGGRIGSQSVAQG